MKEDNNWPFARFASNGLEMSFLIIKDFKGDERWMQSFNSRRPVYLQTVSSNKMKIFIYKKIIKILFCTGLQSILFTKKTFIIEQDAQRLFSALGVSDIGVMLGQTGPSAKNILVLGTLDNDILYLKVVKGVLSRAMIKNESEALCLLREKNLSFKIPELLEYRDNYLLVKSIGEMSHFTRWNELSSHAVSDLEEIKPACTVKTADYFKETRDSRHLMLLPDTIKLVCSHGDFTPWNITANSDQLYIIDWEMFGKRPIGYDFFHFHIQSLIMNSLDSAEDIFRLLNGNECRTHYYTLYESSSFFSQSLLCYLLTIRQEYRIIYKDFNSLHWQAKRAMSIWEDLQNIVYENYN